MQRDAWRTEVGQAGQVKSLPRLCYSSAVLCDNALRVFGRTREQLSSAPRRTRPKRSRQEVDTSLLLGITESGRKVRARFCLRFSSCGLCVCVWEVALMQEGCWGWEQVRKISYAEDSDGDFEDE